MSLTTEQQMLVEQRLNNEKKSVGVGYLLWLVGGGLGIHRFYLGRSGSGAFMLVLTILGFLLLFAMGLGLLLLIPVMIWLLVDAFLIPGMVEHDAKVKRMAISSEISLLSQGAQPPTV